MQVSQIDIANSGDRPPAGCRGYRCTSLVRDFDPSKRHLRGFLVVLPANSLTFAVEQRHAFVASGLGVVPAVCLFPVPRRPMLLTPQFSIFCHEIRSPLIVVKDAAEN